MRLKAATTAFLVFGILLAFLWPYLIGPRPTMTSAVASPPADPTGARGNHARALYRRQLKAYSVRFGVVVGVMIIDFAATAILAILVARQAREEYRRQSTENLKGLVEATLNDHRRPGPEA